MPIYEYRCGACGSHFDQLVRTGEDASCPFCGSSHLERKLSTPALRVVAGSTPSPSRPAGGGCCGGSCGCH